MTDAVDTDDPDEVAVSWRKYRTADTTFGDRVEEIAGKFRVPGGPKSELDLDHTKYTNAVRRLVRAHVHADGRRTVALDGHVTETVGAYSSTDQAGAATVRRAEPT
ncbi:hypothetical protein IU459_23830 [Nocardia amamiensis]|uniref:Centromere-binding protein ParB C-terminal domain-containing protein n=1 Tax=Nocardia amamiensis TaxID=404578 RepID=A0ABS0CW43_9NOCA|nr:hypothetical protein [Nocardia amamiensis]MBF6300551.1 hypothetical protein [Nocardia amamiensis]